MRKLLIGLLCAALATLPARAGSYFFGGSGATYANANATTEMCDASVDGSGTTVQASTSNVIGDYATLCTTAAAWSGFDLYVASSSTAAARWLLTITLNNGSSDLPPIYVQPGGGPSTGPVRLRFPIQVASGATVRIKAQSSTGSATVKTYIQGIVASATVPPGYTTVEAINAVDTTNTRPSTIDIPGTSTWTQLSASTSATYGAMLMACGDNGTSNTNQSVSIAIGKGAGPTEFYRWLAATHTSVPMMHHAASALIEHEVASGSAISAWAAATTTTDNYRCHVLGFR